MNSNKILKLTLADLPGDAWDESHLTIIKYVGLKTDLELNIIIRKLQEYKGDYKKLVDDYKRDKIIDLVVRQTNYTKQEAYDHLVEMKGDYTTVIKNYVGTNIKNTNQNNTVYSNPNQQIFKEIRDFMDDVNNKYEFRKEMDKTQQISQNIITNAIKNNDALKNEVLKNDNNSLK
jgi:hypothetical protein